MTDADPVLDDMFAALAAAPPIFQPSPFWRRLGAHHTALIESPGFARFKRTIGIRYFSWRTLGILRHQFISVFRLWVRAPDWHVLRATFPNPSSSDRRVTSFNPLAAWIYKLYVAMYADVLERNDPLRLLHRVSEPRLGDPFLIRHRGRSLSQDLCNSIHELYTILGTDHRAIASAEVMEIGAGYGRLAYVFLSAFPAIRYTIVDVPPGLYLAQRYLTELFPEIPTFRFRRFGRYGEVREEFEHARLRFLQPQQAELLPSRSFDQVIAISALHEMTRDQVKRYFDLIERVCRGRMYTKHWRVSRASVNGEIQRERDYPVPGSWRTVFHRRHPVQTMFFEALYEVV